MIKFSKKQLSYGAFAGLILFGLIGAYFFYFGFDNWKANRVYDRVMEAQKMIEDAYRNDTYGGKTPQETLDLFVEALRAGDIELASKYFALDDNLSRGQWLQFLYEVKNSGKLETMANDISLYARPMPSSYEGDYSFALFNDDGIVEVLIDMELNPISKVWKIESL